MQLLFGSGFLLVLIIAAVMVFLHFVPLGLWISALAANVSVGIFTLVGMRLRRVPPIKIVLPLIKATKAGMEVSVNKLEAHFLAGGNVDRVIDALIAAQRAEIPLSFERSAAIDLAGVVKHVTVIEFMPELKADAVLVKKLHSLPNVTVHTNAQTMEITGADGKVNGMKYKNRATEAEHLIPLEGVFVQIGLVPNTEWLKGTVELSKFGEIMVDAKGHTNVPGVFAAGDCTTVPFKQIVIAAGDGSKAALSAFDYLIRN